MTAHPEHAKVDELRAAAVVARHVELEDIQLLELQANRLASVDEILRSPSHVEVERRHGFEFEDFASRLIVDFTACVRVVADDRDGKHLVQVVARLQLGYRLLVEPPPVELREAFFRSFAAVNGSYNGWPYLRELVQSTSARMGIPPVVLPVFRIERPRSEQSRQAEPEGGSRQIAKRKAKKVQAKRK